MNGTPYPIIANPNMFAISCKIDSVYDKKAMCNLGDFINVMTLSIYNSLNIPLKMIGVIIQLINKSVVYPKGILKKYFSSSWWFRFSY